MDHMTFKFHSDIYWKVELILYSEVEKCWKVKVLDYLVTNNEAFKKQTPTRIIEKFEFEKLDWKMLEPQLSSYQEIKLIDSLYNHNISTKPKSDTYYQQTEVSFNKSKYVTPEEILLPIPTSGVENHYIPREPWIEKININFSVKFQEATFIDGLVIFKKFIKKVGTQIDFKIENSSILGEFDNIKFWFSKKLKTKKFNVSTTITLIDRKLSNVTASSPEIAMITANIIESIKYDRTIALTKPPKAINPDKSLYSMEDIFQLINPEIKEGNVFNQSGPDIIKSLTQTEYVRNRKQLEYLSDIKQTTESKIHYTLNPLFGFLFLNETKTKYHFVWELLNSHATYIWTLDRLGTDINSLFSKIEEIINVIKLIGREEYKKTYSNQNFGYEFIFKAIDHHDINTNLDEGFIKWKTRLNEILE